MNPEPHTASRCSILESHSQSFLLSCFSNMTSCFLPMAILQLWFFYVCSHISGITFTCHHTQLVGLDVFSLMFCPGLPKTMLLPIANSQEAGLYQPNSFFKFYSSLEVWVDIFIRYGKPNYILFHSFDFPLF
jgi:hypothetical protein